MDPEDPSAHTVPIRHPTSCGSRIQGKPANPWHVNVHAVTVGYQLPQPRLTRSLTVPLLSYGQVTGIVDCSVGDSGRTGWCHPVEKGGGTENMQFTHHSDSNQSLKRKENLKIIQGKPIRLIIHIPLTHSLTPSPSNPLLPHLPRHHPLWPTAAPPTPPQQ